MIFINFRYLEKSKQKYKRTTTPPQSHNDSESQISKQFSSDFSENEYIQNSDYEQSEYSLQDQGSKVDSGPKKRKKNKKGKNKKYQSK